MISVSLNVDGGVRFIKPAKLYMCTQTHYKHDEDGRTAPGVCGNGSVPLSHPGNVVTRIGTHTHLIYFVGQTHGAPNRGYGYVPLRFGGGGVVRRMGTQQQFLIYFFMDRVLGLHSGSRRFDSHRGHMSERFFRSNRPGCPHPVSSELENSGIRVAVGDCSVTDRRR